MRRWQAGWANRAQKHWLGVFHADYRKLKNQARFIQEIIDGDLVVSKKKKDVLVKELRDRDYEAFPRGGVAAKKKSTEDEDSEPEQEEGEDGDVGGSRDYDYLLSVSSHRCTISPSVGPTGANSWTDAHLVIDA